MNDRNAMQKLSSKEFAEMLTQFRRELDVAQPRYTWTDEAILDAFRLWYIDTREQEAWEEAKQTERDQYGEGWKQ
ncbi:MAG: hypothetical protein ACTSYO_08115 [Candidatus Ranarchaeia archaeon]